MSGSFWHLTARFVESVFARPLSDTERDEVRALLTPALSTVFFDQPIVDQRHGLQAARVVMAHRREAPELVAAALTHDIGKRHARLGVIGRSVASVMIRLGVDLPARFRAYRDHGNLGATELQRLGAPWQAVAFARNHHGDRPSDFDESEWELLGKADLPQSPGRSPWRR